MWEKSYTWPFVSKKKSEKSHSWTRCLNGNLTHTWIYQKILPQVPFIRVFWLWFVDLPAFHGSTQQGQVDEKLIEGGFKDRPLSDHLDPPQKMTSAVACERYHFTCIFEIHWAYRWPSTGREEILVECTPRPRKMTFDTKSSISYSAMSWILRASFIFYQKCTLCPNVPWKTGIFMWHVAPF